jgi:integrase
MSHNKLPYIISKEDIQKLFQAVYIPKLSIAMFISLMCGLRVQEARRLEIADINLQEKKLLIKNSKNPNRTKEGYGKDRIVPIPECAIPIIKMWISVVQGHSKFFLPSDKSSEIPVSKAYLEERFNEARTRAGLKSVDKVLKYKQGSYREGRNQYHIKWHSLRHFYACYVYGKTRDLYAVSRLLGHNQVTTTQIYAKVSDKVLRESVDFAFNMPVRTKIFQENPMNALNYNIPEIAKQGQKQKTPVEILEERYAKGEISAVDFQTAIRLLKIRKEYLNENEKQTDNTREVEVN